MIEKVGRVLPVANKLNHRLSEVLKLEISTESLEKFKKLSQEVNGVVEELISFVEESQGISRILLSYIDNEYVNLKKELWRINVNVEME